MNTLPWPLPFALSVFPSVRRSCSSAFYLTSSVVLRNVEPDSNLLLPLSEFVFILTGPLPLHSTYRSISLLPDSASPHHFLCLHASSSFCSLPVSKPLSPYLSLLPALRLLSAFQTLPLLVFHFNLIHNKTQLQSQDGGTSPPPHFCVIPNHEHKPFSLILLSQYLSSSTWGK